MRVRTTKQLPNLLLVGPNHNGKVDEFAEKFRSAAPIRPAPNAVAQEHIPVLVVADAVRAVRVIRFYIALLAAMARVHLRPAPTAAVWSNWRCTLRLRNRSGVRLMSGDPEFEFAQRPWRQLASSRRGYSFNLFASFGNESCVIPAWSGRHIRCFTGRFARTTQLENRFEADECCRWWEAQRRNCCSLLASFAASPPAAATSSIARRCDIGTSYLPTRRSEGTIGELAHLFDGGVPSAAVGEREEAINHRTLSMADYTPVPSC